MDGAHWYVAAAVMPTVIALARELSALLRYQLRHRGVRQLVRVGGPGTRIVERFRDGTIDVSVGYPSPHQNDPRPRQVRGPRR